MCAECSGCVAGEFYLLIESQYNLAVGRCVGCAFCWYGAYEYRGLAVVYELGSTCDVDICDRDSVVVACCSLDGRSLVGNPADVYFCLVVGIGWESKLSVCPGFGSWHIDGTYFGPVGSVERVFYIICFVCVIIVEHAALYLDVGKGCCVDLGLPVGLTQWLGFLGGPVYCSILSFVAACAVALVEPTVCVSVSIAQDELVYIVVFCSEVCCTTFSC